MKPADAAGAPARRRRRRRLGRNARLLVASTVISSIGDWLYRLALPLVVYELTHSPVSMALTYVVEYVPYVVVSPLGGVLADRIDKRRLLAGIELGAALIVGTLAVMLATSRPPVELVLAVVAVLASLAPARHPATQAIVPSVVDEQGLISINARLYGAEGVVAVVGPLLAGAIIASLGTRPALAIDGLSFGVSALAVWGLRAADIRDRPRLHARVRDDLRELMAYLGRDRLLVVGAAIFAAVNFAVFMIEANLVYALVAFERLKPASIGIVFAAQGLGAAAGASVAAPLAARWPLGRIIVAATFGGGLATFALLGSTGIVTVATAWSVESACGALCAVTWFSLRADRAPSDLLGRVVAATRMVAFAAIPAGSLAGSAVLSLTATLAPLVVLSGALQLGVGLVALRTSLYRGSAQRLRPASSVGA